MTRATIIMYQLSGLNSVAKRQRVESVIEAKAEGWFHHMRDSWIVISHDHPEDWTRRIRRHLTDKDQLLVLRVDVIENQGLLSDDGWQWIRENLDE